MWPSGRCGCGRTRRVRSRDECGQDQKARRERLHQGELSSIVLWFVSQPVHNFEGDESGAWSFWKDGHSIAFAWRATPRCQCATCQVGQNAARSCPTLRRELFGTLQNVLINIERRSHLMNITHQSSDVKTEKNQFQSGGARSERQARRLSRASRALYTSPLTAVRCDGGN
jgi:hypothetical protein